MQVVILGKNKELNKSLKRAISLKYSCLVEKSYDLRTIEKKYKDTDSVFILSESIDDKEGINEEGLKLAYLINDRLNFKSVVFGIKKKEKKHKIAYLKIPFLLRDLYDAISATQLIKKELDEQIILEKYEHFRTKIGHDYIQYINKNWPFFKALIINFQKYAKVIFGIDLEETCINKNKIDVIVKKFEKQRSSELLHDLLANFKIDEIKTSKIKDFPELKNKFFKNLDVLIKLLAEKKTPTPDLEEKIAENFFLSWYIWRKFYFLEEYNQFFSDGFYKGCFRSLLSFRSPNFNEIKKETLQKVFNCKNVTDAIKFLKKNIEKIKRIF